MSDQEFRKTPDTDELKAKLSKFLSEKEELEEKLEIDELNTFEDVYHKTVDAIASSANPKKKKNYEEKLEKLKALEKIRNECESLQATIKAIESQPEKSSKPENKENVLEDVKPLKNEIDAPNKLENLKIKFKELSDLIDDLEIEVGIDDENPFLKVYGTTIEKMNIAEEPRKKKALEIKMNTLKKLEQLLNERESIQNSINEASKPDLEELKAQIKKKTDLKEDLEAQLEIEEVDGFKLLYEKTKEKLNSVQDPRKTKALEEKLKKLKELEQVTKELSNLERELKKLQKPPKKNIEELKKKLNELLNIKEDSLYGLEIEEKDLRAEIQKYQDKIMSNPDPKKKKVPEEKLRKLKILEQLMKDISILEEEIKQRETPSDDDSSFTELQKKLDELQDSKEELMIELELENECDLENMINKNLNKIKSIDDVKKKKILEKKLEKMHNLAKIIQEIISLEKNINACNFNQIKKQLTEKLHLKEELEIKLEIDEDNTLPLAIQKALQGIQHKDFKKRSLHEEKLQKLRNLEKITKEYEVLQLKMNNQMSELKDHKEEEKKEEEGDSKKQPKTQKKVKSIPEEKQRKPDKNEKKIPEIDCVDPPPPTDNAEVELMEELKTLADDLQRMPACSEKTVMNLTLKLKSKLAKVSNEEIEYENDLLVLKKQMDNEEIVGSQIDEKLSKITREFRSDDLERASNALINFRKEQLSHLDIHELERLVGSNKEAEKTIVNKDIVLFIGTTGSGKSTTLLYLTGRKMVQKTVFIEGSPIETIDSEIPLAGIKSSHKMKSETRYLHLVDIDLRKVLKDDLEEERMFLCDSPGFGDSRSAEIDIANGVGVVDAIRQAKSVKIVVLLSINSFGDKGEGLRQTCHILLGLIPDIEERLDSFLFMFTKIKDIKDSKDKNDEKKTNNNKDSKDKNDEKKTNNNLEGLLKNFRTNMNEEDKQNKSYVALVKKIQFCASNDNRIQIDPLDGEPGRIIRKINNVAPIKCPKEAFSFYVANSSNAKLNEQAGLYYKQIILAAERNDFTLANYGLDKLKFLHEMLHQDSFIQKYHECVSFVGKKLKQLYDSEISSFNRFCNVKSELTQNDIDNYKILIRRAEEFEPCRKAHFLNFALEKENFYQNLAEKAKELIELMKNNELEDMDNIKILDKVELIAKEFEIHKQIYSLAVEEIKIKLSTLINSIKSYLTSRDFNNFGAEMNKLQIAENLLKKHVNFSKDYSNLKQLFLEDFEHKEMAIKKILNKDKIEDNDINNLKLEIGSFEKVKSEMKLQNHIPIEKFNEIYQRSLGIIKSYFKKAEEDLNSAFNNEKLSDLMRRQLLSNLEACLKRMKEIKSISTSVAFETSDSYLSVINILKLSMDKLNSEVEDNLNLLSEKMENLNLNWKKLAISLSILKNCSWMELYVDNLQSYAMSKIETCIDEFAENLKSKIKEIQLDFNKPDEITKAIELLTAFSSLNFLNDFYPNLGKSFEIIRVEFEENIKLSIFDRIESLYKKEKNLSESEKNFERISTKKIILFNQYLEKITENTQAPTFLRNKAISILNEFREHLKKYYRNLLSDFKKDLDEVRNFDILSKKEDIIESIVNSLCDVLKKITSFPMIPDVNDDIENPIVSLDKFYSDLENQIIAFKSKNLWKECYTKIKLASYLYDLDRYLNFDSNESKSSFKKLHLENEKHYTDQLPDLEKRALNALVDYDFASLNDIMNILGQRNDAISKQALENIESQLQKNYNRLIRETKKESKEEFPIEKKNYLGSLEKAKKIENSTKNLESATIYLSVPLQKKFKINTVFSDAKKDIESSLESMIETKLNNIEMNELEINKFADFENHINFIVGLIKIFESFTLKATNENVAKLTKRKKEVIDSLVTKYDDLKFADLKILKDVRKDLNNLKEMKDKFYNETLEKIETIIISKLQSQLSEARETMNTQKLKYYIEKITKNIESNIENTLKTHLIALIEDVSKEETETFENRTQRLSELFSSENFEEIHKFYAENVEIPEIKANIFQFVMERLKAKYNSLIKEMSENKVTKFFQTLKTTQEILEIFQQSMKLEIEKQRLTLKNDLSNKLQDCIMLLQQFFDRDSASFTEPNDQILGCFIFLFESIKEINNDSSKTLIKYFDDFQLKVKNLLIQIKENYDKNFEIFNKFASDQQFNCKQIKCCIEFAKNWDALLSASLQKLPNFSSNFMIDEVHQIKELKKTLQFNIIVEIVKEKLGKLEKEIKVENMEKDFINDKQAEDFYYEIKIKKDIIKEAAIEFKPFIEKINNVVNELNEMDNYAITNLTKDLFSLIENELEEVNCVEINQKLTKIQIIFKNLRSSDKGLEKSIDEIKNQIAKKANELYKIAICEQKSEKLAVLLIHMKVIATYLFFLKEKTNKNIEDVLAKYKRDCGGEQAILELGLCLENYKDGKFLTDEHQIFKGYKIGLYNQKIPKYSIEDVINDLTGNFLKKDKLLIKYREYEQKNKEIIQQNLRKNINIDKVIDELKQLTIGLGNNGLWGAFSDRLFNEKKEREIKWTGNIKDQIHIILAYVFAIWTLLNAGNYLELDKMKESKEHFLFIPHCAQVLSILRIFGSGDEKNTLQNNIVQIGTGEGKSLTLAITSSIFALLGFDVSCACYSQYLSERDYNSFLLLFEKLDIKNDIHYGTFNVLCERVINEKGDIRKIVSNLISGKGNEANKRKDDPMKPRILLIDEVDVFFSKDFYGQLYTPSASVYDNSINELMQYIWDSRMNNLTLNYVKNLDQYKKCQEFFKTWSSLLEEAVKMMICDVQSFESHGYIVKDNRIAYKEQDNLVYNSVMGYKTFFAYMDEILKGNIQRSDDINNFMSIGINCGNFSYADLPLKPNFYFILGVTGTLETLNEEEKKVILTEYGIKKQTFCPSVFGKNKLSFNQKEHIKICDDKDYFNEIITEINDRLSGINDSSSKRAVIVVFEDITNMMAFYKYDKYNQLQKQTSLLSEENTSIEKDIIVKQATMTNKITLITRTFGRGTDFVCRDDKVGVQGGVHVIQTFFSKTLSEEVQIKGRTARQGDKGSYSMILLEKDLEYFMGAEKLDISNKSSFYVILNEKRNKKNIDEYLNNKKFVATAKEKHNASTAFLENMEKDDKKAIETFLKNENLGPAVTVNECRTLILMDATGSMSSLLEKAKTTVFQMFERTAGILKENKLNANCFSLQFAVYRNYNSKENEILEHSPWETKPTNLWAFMKKIDVDGGWGNEALEIGLFHANNEASTQFGISQIILIGDAPANSDDEIVFKKNDFGKKYWKKSKFDKAGNYVQEMHKLRDRGIKIHGYYVDQMAQTNFKEISECTGGNCAFLDVNDIANGAELLTKMVSEELLRNIGEQHGIGEKLVQCYRKAYK